MSITKTKDNLNLRMMPMHELRDPLQLSLRKDGYLLELENQSENDLGFKVKKTGYTSYLRLFRTKHRPLLIEIEVDYNYYSNQKQQFKAQQKKARQARQDSSLRGSMWRMYWYYWLFGGIIASIVYFFSGFFFFLIENLTPGWTNTSRAILIVVLSALVVVLYVLAIPTIIRRKNEYAHKNDKEVIKIVKRTLEEIKDSEIDSEFVKCWSCFEEIPVGTEKCPECKADQT